MRSTQTSYYSLFALSRLLALYRLRDLLEKFQIYLKRHSVLIAALRAILLLLVLWHWTSCIWFFIDQSEGDKYPKSWFRNFNIGDKSASEQYFLSMYYVIKIVTGVGQSDMIAYNNLERVIFMIIINIGDAIFGYSFGLIA
jgi:hypothetical protein